MLSVNDLSLEQGGKKIINNKSQYKPSAEEVKMVMQIQSDFQIGHEIMNKSYTEFNDRSLISYMNDCQMAFNSYVPPRSEDPDESWRAQTVRPVTRNKLMSIAAHATVAVLIPTVFAQNKQDEEDKDAAQVMQDLIQWIIDNTEYPRKFVYAIIGALVNPATIIHADFVEVMRTVREKQKDGTITSKEVVDEVLSGFQSNIVPVDELYISNIRENNIQKQRFLIRRKIIDYTEAKAKYGKKDNFSYVKPGVQNIYVDGEAMFYEQEDKTLNGSNVEVITYYHRTQDLQVTVINGIVIGSYQEPNPRKDKLYPFAKSGYELIDEGMFFYYKSAADKLGPDQELVDTLYNMVLDGSFLALMPPIATFGDEELDSSIFIPGSSHSFGDSTKVEAIGPKSDIRAGISVLGEVERSLTESSVDPRFSGQSTGGDATAYEISRLETNSQKAMGMFGKMIGFLVEDYGKLMVGDILQHITVGEVEQLVDGSDIIKYKKFLLPNIVENGRKFTKQIEFTNRSTTESGREKRSYELLKKQGGMNADKKIYEVNPDVFRKLRFSLKVDVDTMFPKSKSLEKALNLEMYDRAIANPLIDQEQITIDMLEMYKPGRGRDYIKKGTNPGQEAQKAPGGVNQNMIGQVTGNNSLKNTLLQDSNLIGL